MNKKVINFSKVSFITENYEEINFSNYNFYSTYFIYLSTKKKYKYFWRKKIMNQYSSSFFHLKYCLLYYVIILRFFQINIYVLI